MSKGPQLTVFMHGPSASKRQLPPLEAEFCTSFSILLQTSTDP